MLMHPCISCLARACWHGQRCIALSMRVVERTMSGGTGAVHGRPSMHRSANAPESDSGVGTAFHGWPHASFLELAALPTAVPCGRLHAKNVVCEWGLGCLSDTVELLVSELLSNAVKASSSPAGAG